MNLMFSSVLNRKCGLNWLSRRRTSDMAIARSSSTDIREQALAQGMRTLRDDGWRRVLNGSTTIAEVLRVTEEGD